MAFSPFHAFRKHQKIIFAALTIMCMVTFVLSYGKGDFFSTITDWIAGRSHLKTAGTLYGKSVSDREIDQLQRQRELANRYMLLARGTVQKGLGEELVNLQSAAAKDAETAQRLQMLEQEMVDESIQLSRNRNVSREDLEQFQSVFMAKKLDTIAFELEAGKKTEKANLIRKLNEVGILSFRLRRTSGPFFEGSSKTLKDLLEFKIWLHQADRLGIQLPRPAVLELVNRAYFNRLSPKDQLGIHRRTVENYRSLPPETVDTALANEFRVKLAKAAFLGYDALRSDPVLPAVTPYESWQFFKGQRAKSHIVLLPIPVENKDFLARAQAEFAKLERPEETLQALFKEHKGQLRAPDWNQAGFKQGPRLEIEWISASPDLAFYREEAKKTLARRKDSLLPAQQVAAAALCPGGGGLAAAEAVAAIAFIPTEYDLLLLSQYGPLKNTEYRTPSWDESDFVNSYQKTWNDLFPAWKKPAPVAALIGQVWGAAGTGGSPLAFPAYLQGSNSAANLGELKPILERERRSRLDAAAALFLSGADPIVGMPSTLIGSLSAIGGKENYLPLEKVKGLVKEKLEDMAARELIKTNLEIVRSELNRIASSERCEETGQTRKARLQTVAASFGQAVAGGGAPSLLDTLTTYAGLELTRDFKARSRLGAETVLEGASSPWSAAARVYKELLQPAGTVPAESFRAFLAQAQGRYGLNRGATEKPRDRFDISKDKGLEALKEDYRRTHLLDDVNLKNFYDYFSSSVYSPAEASKGPESILYWKSADWPAYVPSFEEARDLVKERWIFEKARELARKEAEETAVRAREAGKDAVYQQTVQALQAARAVEAGGRFTAPFFCPPQLVSWMALKPRPIDLVNAALEGGSPHSGKVFQLLDVARLEKPRFALQSQDFRTRNSYSPYQLPSDKIEYPDGKFLEKLLALQPGETAVLEDRPEATYYVAAALDRQISEDDFHREYSQHAQALLACLREETHSKIRLREEVMARLEKEAQLKVNEDFLNAFENRQQSREE